MIKDAVNKFKISYGYCLAACFYSFYLEFFFIYIFILFYIVSFQFIDDVWGPILLGEFNRLL